MREGGCAAKGEFEGLLEEEAAEDHEVVAVAVLGLHYLGGVDAGAVHVDDVVGFAGGVVGIWGVVVRFNSAWKMLHGGRSP